MHRSAYYASMCLSSHELSLARLEFYPFVSSLLRFLSLPLYLVSISLSSIFFMRKGQFFRVLEPDELSQASRFLFSPFLLAGSFAHSLLALLPSRSFYNFFLCIPLLYLKENFSKGSSSLKSDGRQKKK